jgi:5-methylcytosine-specific restriction endonuclease McrA
MIPEKTRNEVNRRASGCCEDCGERLALQLHHLHYDTIGCESPEDLQALCDGCHERKHYDEEGNFWKDPQELKNIRDAFDNAISKQD